MATFSPSRNKINLHSASSPKCSYASDEFRTCHLILSHFSGPNYRPIALYRQNAPTSSTILLNHNALIGLHTQ